MIDDQISECEAIRDEIKSLTINRRSQCERIQQEMRKTKTPEDRDHLIRTHAILLKDRGTLLGMLRLMTKTMIELERLRISIKSADEMDSFRKILEQTRSNLSGISRTQGEIEVLVEEMDESTACLIDNDGSSGYDGGDTVDEMNMLLVQNLPLAPEKEVLPPKLYSSIVGSE